MLPILRNSLIPSFSEQSLLGRWSDLRREIDRWFESTVPDNLFATTWTPAMDVDETDDALRLTFEIPGVPADDLNVTFENGVLKVSGEKRFERESQDDKSGARTFERRYGRFERTVVLPQSIDPDKATAHCEHGVLTIELPKTSEARPRRIEITHGKEQVKLGSGKAERNAA